MANEITTAQRRILLFAFMIVGAVGIFMSEAVLPAKSKIYLMAVSTTVLVCAVLTLLGCFRTEIKSNKNVSSILMDENNCVQGAAV